MNEEIDESEFYHQDFTTASEWEIFIARLEEIIAQWKNDDVKNEPSEFPDTEWQIRTETVSFVDFDFTISHHRKPKITEATEEDKTKRNPFDSLYDFELYDPKNVSTHSCLSCWYGIDEFIVISPTGNAGITTESRVKVLLSSAYVAAGNTKCAIPIFVQIREKWQQNYLGVYECEEIRTNVEMIHLKYTPRLCHTLSGLLELFRSKIVSSTMNTMILVSVLQSYVLTDFGNFVWKQQYTNPDNEAFDPSYLFILPFGVTGDPITSVVLKTIWSHLSHRSVRDSENYTDFVPLNALKWTVLVNSSDLNNLPVCLLGDCLSEILSGLDNSSTMFDVIGDFITVAQPDASNPLDLLTEPKVPTISTLLSRAARNSISKSRRGQAPLSEDVLVMMLYYLFPDADDVAPKLYKDGVPQNGEQDIINLEHECRGFKTCTVDSLVWRLATALAHCQQSLGGYRALTYLWYEFVQEMRYRWEKSVSIPGLLQGCPDLRTCLLHQKLQMLNCCIERKHTREHSGSFDSAEGSSTDDDDEFFDCADKPDEDHKRKEKHSLWNQPVGRLGKFNNLKLIVSGDPLYIPITQEPVPKSEDQLEEDTDVLLKLGSDAQGSELRAKMMSASLLSDMESFKAANPGSILEDFIRWYSPRDWIEEDDADLDEWGQKKGQLSSRMMIEDNFWVQTWLSAKPVPANRQKRLFDDTREAEKVLHFLDSRTVAQICELIAPVLCHAAIYKLADELRQVSVEIGDSQERLRSLIKAVERLSRESKLQARRFQNIIHEMSLLELKISEVNSLMYKFNPAGAADEEMSDLVGRLVTGCEVEISDKSESTVGTRLMAMFAEAQRNANMILSEPGQDDKGNACFPSYSEREVVMRVSVPRPAVCSAECPQFMRAVLNKNEFRLCGAFSEDIVFF